MSNDGRNSSAQPSAAGSERILVATDVRRVFEVGRSSVAALRGVSLEVIRGETVSIMGASGAGKSTLLHILGALERPTGGRVDFKGRDVYAMSPAARTEVRAKQMGFVFQSYHLLPELDVVENVMLPSMSRVGARRRAGEARDRALELLKQVGLDARAEHRPMELSGGEQQRVALARALMNEPELVLADEPTGNLDSKTGFSVLEVLFGLVRERGHTLILVTHNEGVADLCGRRLVLHDGVMAF